MEDRLFDTDLQTKEDKVSVLIIYDIVDNHRRTQLVKFLQGYGFRVQKSAFEAVIRKNAYIRLISEIGNYATKEDNIRVYKIIGKNNVKNFGQKIELIDEEIIII